MHVVAQSHELILILIRKLIALKMTYTEGAKEKDQSITDPCYKERQISLKCMDEKNYDKNSCYREFENFKN